MVCVALNPRLLCSQFVVNFEGDVLKNNGLLYKGKYKIIKNKK